MTDKIRITLAQLNPTLGDLEGNASKARSAWEKGKAAGADFVAFSPRISIVCAPKNAAKPRPPLKRRSPTLFPAQACGCGLPVTSPGVA